MAKTQFREDALYISRNRKKWAGMICCLFQTMNSSSEANMN